MIGLAIVFTLGLGLGQTNGTPREH